MIPLAILIITLVNADMTLIQEPLPNDTEQYHIYITGITETGKCQLQLTAEQENSDFIVTKTSTFDVIFLSGGSGVQVLDMRAALAFFEFSSCPSSIELIFGPIVVIHIRARILVQSIILASTIYQFSVPLDYSEFSNQQFSFVSDSALTSAISTLIITYTPLQTIAANDKVNLILPFRDPLAVSPSSFYFKTTLLVCDVTSGGVVKQDIQCFFDNNILTITSISYQTQMTIKVYDFQNPQSLDPLVNVEFQLIRFITSTEYILESKTGLSISATTPSTSINTIIYLSDNHINTPSTVTLLIQYSDYLYIGTTLSITFPIAFLTAAHAITLGSNLRQDFTLVEGSSIIIDNFIQTEGIQPLIQIYFQTTTPIIMKDYPNLLVKFSYSGIQIAQSQLQNIQLQPLIYTTLTMTNQNKKIVESTNYCFSFTLDQPIVVSSQIKIEFYSPVTFDSTISLINVSNLDSNAAVVRQGQIILITNVFTSTQFNQPISFCLSGIYNPYYIDMESKSYDITILYNNIAQVLSQNILVIDLEAGDLEVTSASQSNSITNTQNNNITLLLKTHSGLKTGDLIVFQFDNSKYDFDLVFENRNVISCSIESQANPCNLMNHQIQMQSQITILPSTTVTIIIQNFITCRSLNPVNSIGISTRHKTYQIDTLSQPANLIATEPNESKYFAIQSSSNKQNAQTQLLIQFSFITNLLQTDNTQISIPDTLDCSTCVCQSPNCAIANSIISITQVALINSMHSIIITDAIHPDLFAELPILTITATDQQGFLLYKDTTKLITTVNQFSLFELTPQNTTVGISTLYQLRFIPTVQIKIYDKLTLELNSDYGILSLSCDLGNCIFNNGTIQLSFDSSIKPNQTITLNLNAITNPLSTTSRYYYTLSHTNNNGIFIQQSTIRSGTFSCLFDDCFKCQAESCQICNPGYLKIEGRCLLDCPKGYLIIGESCVQCQAGKHCAVCSSINLQQCLLCNSGYQLISDQCIKIDFYNTTDQNNSSNTRDNTTINSTILPTISPTRKQTTYSIGLLNYIQLGVFATLILTKLSKKQVKLFFTYQIFLGFSVPVFRIFSLLFFVLDKEYTISCYTFILITISLFQSIHFQEQIEAPLILDRPYKEKVKEKNHFYLNNLLFRYMDFRILCLMRSKFNKSDFCNYNFTRHEMVNQAVYANYKRLITIVNPLTFSQLLTSILITSCHKYKIKWKYFSYQYEFLLFTAVEWVTNCVVFYQIRKNQF